MIPYSVASILIFIHRAGVTNHILAQGVFVILASHHLINLKRPTPTTAALLSLLLNKPANAIPIALLLELVNEFTKLNGRVGSFMKLCLLQCAYYYLGLWNSVSAIDLTFGALFSKNFDMRIAPFILLIYTLSGPILVSISLPTSSTDQEMLALRSVLDFSACAFAYKHRFHPWIFDFFSPKIMFQVFWSVFYCLLLPLIEYTCK